MLIGYARVSSHDQNLELQRDALDAAGCEKVFEDKASGARIERPEWPRAKDHLREGDTLVVWRLDRLGRSPKHLITTIDELDERGGGSRSLQENLATATAGCRLLLHLCGALAAFPRQRIR